MELKRDEEAAGEKLLEDALEAGAEDVEEDDDDEEEAEEVSTRGGSVTLSLHARVPTHPIINTHVQQPAVAKVARVYCEPAALAEVRRGLESAGWAPSLVQFSYVPKDYVDVQEAADGEGPALIALLDALEEDPDVQNVFHNARLV